MSTEKKPDDLEEFVILTVGGGRLAMKRYDRHDVRVEFSINNNDYVQRATASLDQAIEIYQALGQLIAIVSTSKESEDVK